MREKLVQKNSFLTVRSVLKWKIKLIHSYYETTVVLMKLKLRCIWLSELLVFFPQYWAKLFGVPDNIKNRKFIFSIEISMPKSCGNSLYPCSKKNKLLFLSGLLTQSRKLRLIISVCAEELKCHPPLRHIENATISSGGYAVLQPYFPCFVLVFLFFPPPISY